MSEPKAAIVRSLAIAAFGFILVSNPKTLNSIRFQNYSFSFTITDYSAVKFLNLTAETGLCQQLLGNLYLPFSGVEHADHVVLKGRTGLVIPKRDPVTPVN